jgi:hypothetical protein
MFPAASPTCKVGLFCFAASLAALFKSLQPLAVCRFSASVSVKVFTMHATPILQYLQKHGQRLDSEIAAATGIPLPKVRTSLSDLSARGEISKCSVTRFNDGKPVEGVLCRIAGFIPPATPGRKPGR